jgi:2-polyprenyl-3-methyl-5-hydroxy-6-metoxy-1,4-benzoquinol methylase
MGTGTEQLEAIAGTYDSAADFDFHLIRYNYREMRPRMRGPAVLEMGCASGVMTRWLANDFPLVHVVDGSALYLRQLAPAVGPHVHLHHSLFEDFRPPRRFDDIVMARALEHLDDPVGLLTAMRDWLAPGGRLHLVVPNSTSLHRRVGVAMGMLERPDSLSERDHKFGHRRVYNADLLREHLTLAGWTAEQVTGVFLKPLSNAQMTAFAPELLDAFFEVGRALPDFCAELYAVAHVRHA